METDFEQSYYPRAAKAAFRIGQVNISSRKWMACFNEFYENIQFFNLMA